MQPARARLRSPLALALGVIVLLLVALEVFSFAESRRLHTELGALVRTAERSTYLMGTIGHTLSRARGTALETVTEEEAGGTLQRLDDYGVKLSSCAAELPGLLTPDERRSWSAIAPEVERVMEGFRAAVRKVEAGDVAGAEADLDVLGRELRTLSDDLDVAMEQNHRQTRATLAAVDRMLVRARFLQLSLGMLLSAAVVAIAWRALRVLQRREREIDRYVARVEEANRDLEAFAGRVAHDLRNVLTPLPLSAQLLAQGGGDPELISETSEAVARVSQRANELISGLLAFARAGEPTPGAVSGVEEELQAVLDELGPLVRAVDADVRLEVDPGQRVACDRALLHVVLLNLLSNAVKFLEGRPRREVRVRSRDAGASVAIEVSDTGPGIPAELLDLCFEPFYRAPGNRASGEGIGLATVSRIVEAHGGDVQVRSTVGEGSTFRVLLPGAPASTPIAAAAP